MSFSERQGLILPRTLFQIDDLDKDTRIAIWNVIAVLPDALNIYGDPTESSALTMVWTLHFKKPRDERPHDNTVWQRVKKSILTEPYNRVLDLAEDLPKFLKRSSTYQTDAVPAAVRDALNEVFESYLVGYRFVGKEIAPLDSALDVDAIEQALSDSSLMTGARQHLKVALGHLSDRADPDYANSIKESISAVEAVCRAVTGQQTLGQALKKLELKGLTIHPALQGAWSQLYGWTSDADGIRHGSIDESDADQTLAKYMLISCSSFVSYLIDEARKVGLLT